MTTQGGKIRAAALSHIRFFLLALTSPQLGVDCFSHIFPLPKLHSSFSVSDSTLPPFSFHQTRKELCMLHAAAMLQEAADCTFKLKHVPIYMNSTPGLHRTLVTIIRV